MNEGIFRKDLYYRLKVVVIEMPPLRERPEDILLALQPFHRGEQPGAWQEGERIASEARQFMTQYHWPGNVRELRNVVERAMILTDQ